MDYKTAVLFTGLVRNPDNFHKLLDTLEVERTKDMRIAFSTWDGEVEKYPDILKRLVKLGAAVVHQPQPDLIMIGHVLHQLAAIELGLRALPADSFVLKLRPDLSYPDDIIHFKRLVPVAPPSDCLLERSLRSRFFVKGAISLHPLYVQDISFAGLSRDMLRLCQLGFLDVIRNYRLAPEQQIWGMPFVRDIPALTAYFRVNLGLIFNNNEQNAIARRVLHASPLFAKSVALGIHLFRGQFGFLSEVGDYGAVYDYCAGRTLEELTHVQQECDGICYLPSAQINFWRSPAPFDAVADSRIASSPFGDRVEDALRSIAEGCTTPDWECGNLESEAAQLAYDLATNVGISGQKPLRWFADRMSVDGAYAGWTVGKTGTELTERLEQEINVLRRTVDELNRELASRPGTQKV